MFEDNSWKCVQGLAVNNVVVNFTDNGLYFHRQHICGEARMPSDFDGNASVRFLVRVLPI